jgi:hypothetical protein
VEFKEAINAPGREVDQYPTREKAVVSQAAPNNRLSSKQHFNLWHDDAYVYVGHPDNAGMPEKVPMSNVLAMRETPLEGSKPFVDGAKSGAARK